MDSQKLTYPELRDLFVEHNKTQLAKPVSACIVFADSNWPDRHYLLHQPVRFLLGWHRPDGSPRLVHEGLRQQGRLGR